jgi:hypothetical protein
MNFVILRSSRLEIGSESTNRSVRRMTPILKLRANSTSVFPAERDFDAAAADVDDHGGLRRVDAVDRGEMNQPRFLGAGDDAGADAGAPLDGAQERAAVFRFARRAGRDGEDLIDLVRFGEAREFLAAPAAPRPSPRRQLLAVEAAGAQPDHFLFAIDDLEREVRTTRTTIMWTEFVPMSMAASRRQSIIEVILAWSIRPSPSRCFANDSFRC